jgi:hypothetical protein
LEEEGMGVRDASAPPAYPTIQPNPPKPQFKQKRKPETYAEREIFFISKKKIIQNSPQKPRHRPHIPPHKKKQKKTEKKIWWFRKHFLLLRLSSI